MRDAAQLPAPEPTPEARPAASPRERLLHLAVAVLIVLLGAVVVWEAREIRVLPTHARVGPRVIPYLVGSGLIAVGVWLAVEAWSGRLSPPGGDAEDADPTLPPDWRCLAMIGLGLLFFLLLIERAGFVVAGALLFLSAAVGMGSRHPLRDAALAIALATGVYLLFAEGLGVNLPAGWLDGLGVG